MGRMGLYGTYAAFSRRPNLGQEISGLVQHPERNVNWDFLSPPEAIFGKWRPGSRWGVLLIAHHAPQ